MQSIIDALRRTLILKELFGCYILFMSFSDNADSTKDGLNQSGVQESDEESEEDDDDHVDCPDQEKPS